MSKPSTDVRPNTWGFLSEAMIAPSGFREYDARWKYPSQINLKGVEAIGLGIGTQMMRRGVRPLVCVGNDYREYSLAIKQALCLGLLQAGVEVVDIGVALSPMAYYARPHLKAGAVAMVTASHNPNGWTGVKVGFEHPLTHGPDEMAELKKIVLEGDFDRRDGGRLRADHAIKEKYIADLAGTYRLSRPLKVVCATGNGTASVFAPDLLRRIGATVIELHTELDYTFPNYNPNPEALEMLEDMSHAVSKSGADLALGFDGDGDRCGVVDDKGHEIFADKIGLLLARDYAPRFPNAHFVVDVKSTGLFATDPVLKRHGATAEYWKTGHSHMKRRVKETGALAGFEKSGHYFIGGDIGHGFDCGLRVATEICKLLDRNSGRSLSMLAADLPLSFSSPTMSPACPDDQKYQVVERILVRLKDLASGGGQIAGQAIMGVNPINGARVQLADGSWALVRASSNSPNLVVVCESMQSAAHLKQIFADVDAVIRTEKAVGEYDQKI